MRNIFIISDTHFGHENILKFTDDRDGSHVRPNFSSVEEMDEHMVERWNSVVRYCDIVYHLGDVYFDNGHRVLKRLKGRKRLVLGNHDNPKSEFIMNNFSKIMMWRMFPEFDCVLTHVPIHESGMFKIKYNLHGHIHQNPSPTARHINCCVELNDYTPKTIEECLKQE